MGINQIISRPGLVFVRDASRFPQYHRSHIP